MCQPDGIQMSMKFPKESRATLRSGFYANRVTGQLIGLRTVEHLESLLPILNMKPDDETSKAYNELVLPGFAVANFHNTAGWVKGKIV